MKRMTLLQGFGFGAIALMAAGTTLAQIPGLGGASGAGTLLGVDCNARPKYHCEDGAVCDGPLVTQPGDTVEMKTRRTYFLDCPAGYKAGDHVTLVLSLHGAGSYANWQRHYAPFMDAKDKYHLVVMTPGSPTRTWSEADDEYLHNIVDSVVGAVGKGNVDRFILAGHSQGGITSRRLVCTDYFKDKVDVRISLSGGRIGPSTSAGRGFGGGGSPVYQQNPDAPPAAAPAGRGGAAPAGPGRGGAPGAAAGAGRGGAAPTPDNGGDCDYSFIFENGQFESTPGDTSPIATKFNCGPRARLPDAVDQRKGMVWDSTRQDPGTDGWGHYPRSGRAQVWEFPNCRGGHVVADMMRLGKGHTEGLEPNAIDTLLSLAMKDPGGKIRNGAWSPPAPPARGGVPGAGRGAAPGAAAPGRGGAAPGRGG